MLFGLDQAQLAFLLLTAVAAGGAVLALAYPLIAPTVPQDRLKGLVPEQRSTAVAKAGREARSAESQKGSRRKKVQAVLKQIEERNTHKRVTLNTLIGRAGLSISPRMFWLMSAVVSVLLALISAVAGFPWYVTILVAVAGLLGLPRWFLGFLGKRRQKAFIEELPDAIEVMVRGLKAGLPISDAMRVIATETGPVMGPEFMEVVEGQRLGITIDQGLERMYERMPLPEVSFLGIVVNIQSKTGGNLSEALANLAKVLRERKKMKAKVRAVSQEAKSSAAIIGAIPLLIVLALYFLNPGYLAPLFTTSTGNMLLWGAGIWMFIGILVMRQMINFEI